MGKKARKYFFGIFEDGAVLKIAQLISSNGHPILVDIKKTEMECSIYHDADRDFSPPPSAISENVDDFQGLNELGLDESSELDSVVNPHEHLLSIFPLNQGRISLNANDEKLTVHYLDRSLKNLSKKGLIKLSLLSQDDIRDKDVTWGFVQTAQDQTCVMIHKGENRLFSYLQKYNQIQSDRKYYYSLIDCNDISVINALRLNYEFNKEDDVLILYLGYDYKKGIILKGNEFVKSLPILTSADGLDLQREITSKLTLYHDEMEIPNVERIIVGGEYCGDEMIEAVAETFPSATVERFKFSELLFSEDLTEELPEEELASYMIPISLAWKIMESKNQSLLHTNFLEKKVIKSQRLVQFSWHSFLMLAILLGLSFFNTTNLLEQQQRLNQMESNFLQKKMEYENLQQQYEPGKNVDAEIAKVKNEISYVKSFYTDKAIWSHILVELNKTFKQYPVSWLTNIQGNDNGFSIFGTTTNRANIIKFAGMFVAGTIKSVQSRQYEDDIVWIFEINYQYLPALPIVQGWAEDISPVEKKIEEIPISKPQEEASKVVIEKVSPSMKAYSGILAHYYAYEHKELITKADDFIKKYPSSDLVVNCRYLMGETYYKTKEYQKAEELFDLVLTVESPMEPYALFKSAQIYSKTGRRYLALVNLNLIKKKYPESDVIPKVENLRSEIEVINE